MELTDYLAYALTVFIAFIWSYFYLVIFAGKSVEDNLKRQINGQLQQVLIHVANTVVQPISALWLSTLQVGNILLRQAKYVLFLTLLSGFAILMHYEHQDIMSGIDQLWRCFGHTGFYDFFVPLLQVIRVLYGFFTPLYNLLTIVYYQLIEGTAIIFFKCSVSTIFVPIEYFVMGITDLLLSFIQFLGFNDLSETNNIAVNDFNVRDGSEKILQAVNATQIGLRCVCESFDPAFDIVFAPVTSQHLPNAIDHGVNTILRFIQTFLRIVVPPGEIPNSERVFYHFYGFIMESAFFLDESIQKTLQNILAIFNVRSTFVMPKELIFSTAARYYVASIELGVAWGSFVTSLFNPLVEISFNLDTAWSNAHLAIYDQSNIIHWFFYLVENVIGGIALGTPIEPEDLPTEFECDWVKDYAEGGWPAGPHVISYTAACTTHNAALTGLGMAMVAVEMSKELLFKSIILQQQNVLRVMQKYDGMWQSREELSTCEIRKARATPLNGTHRLDWTIDANICKCDKRLGEYIAPDPSNNKRYENGPVYNPWCGQPTLQDQILAPLDATLIYITHGIFGPTGIGEVFQFVSPSEVFNIALLFPTRVITEIIRVAVRIVLSLPDIFNSNWVYYDINCGYGLNKTILDFRYQQIMGIEYNETSGNYEKNGMSVQMPVDDEILRFGPCKKRQFRFPGLSYNPKDDMQLCTNSNNNEDCMCNAMLPLNISMPCGCISSMPDVMYGDPFTKYLAYRNMTKASYRWCNSNYLEWFFYMENQLYDSLAYLISFGPFNEDCVRPMDIKPDTSYGSYYLLAELSTTDTTDDCEYKSLFNLPTLSDPCESGTCKIWGNDNVFCSASMAFRENKNLVVNTQRQIHNNLVQVMGGNFNKFNLDISQRICDAEKIFGAFLSSATTVMTFGGARGLRKSLGKLGMALVEWYVMASYKLLNNLQQFLLNYIDEIKKQATGQTSTNAFDSGMKNHVRQFIKSTISVLVDIVVLIVNAFGDLFDAIEPNSGQVFRDIADVLNVLADALAGTILDILGMIIDLFVEMLAFFSGKSKDVGTFIAKLFDFVFKILEVMIQKLSEVLKAIFMMLGPTIGGFLNSLMTGVCSAINTVICGLTFGENCNIMTCVSSGFGNPENQPLGATWKHHDMPRLFEKHYHTVEGIPAPQFVAEAMDWNGTSKCDLFIEGVKYYNYTEMRPLERATWLECLEFRAIGNELDQLIGIPELKLYDILYNHHRKWTLAFHLSQTLAVVSKIYVQDGAIHTAKVRKILIELNIPPEGPLKVLNLLQSIDINFHMQTILHEFMKAFDPFYAKPDRTTRTAKIYQTVTKLHKASNKATELWAERDISKKSQRLFHTVSNMKLSKHNIVQVPHNVRLFFKTVGHHVRRTKRMKKPLNIDITFPDKNSVLCPNTDSIFCVKCTILDNFFETIKDWGNAYALFLIEVYTPELQSPDPVSGFVQPGTLVDTKKYFHHMFTNNSGFIDDIQKLQRSKRKLHRLFNSPSTYNATLVPNRWPAVQKDWETIEIKKIAQAVKLLLSTTDDKYVPYFGYGLPYTATYIVTESCDVNNAIWNQGSQSERLAAMDYAFIICLCTTVVLMYNGLWSVAPLGILVNSIVLLGINTLLFFYIVYGYMPSCVPAMPQMLMEDLLEWIQQRIAPGCFCESWPSLTSEWCSASTCYQCDIAAGRYQNCLEHFPMAEEYGVWWILPVTLRWLWPESIAWIAETGLFGDKYIQDVVFDAYSNPNATSTLQQECILVTSGDLVINGVALLIISFLFAQMTVTLGKAIINIFIMLWQIILLLEWVAIAIEQSAE